MIVASLKKIVQLITLPIERYFLSYIYMTLLFFVPYLCCLVLFENDILFKALKGLFCDSFVVYILLLMISIIRNYSERFSIIVKWATFFVISIMFAFSLATSILFSTKNLYFTILLILETSIEEVCDFFSVYKWEIIFGICLIVCAITTVFLLIRNEEKKEFSFLKKHKYVPVVISICVIIQAVCFIFYHHYGQTSSYYNMTIKLVKDYRVQNCVAETNRTISVDSCDFTSSNIILIIDESYNKYHSNLYGYNKETSPRLSKESNLMTFSDVVAPINYTYGCFGHFLSLASVDQDCNWYDAPLFPSVFKKAGYNVTWWENQTASCRYIDKSSELFYDVKNYKKYVYDDELLAEYRQRRDVVEKDSNNLIMFHLIGMHYDYSNRYPSSQSKFNSQDYLDRSELDEKEKNIVACYDNAVLYNDSIISNIIEMFKNKDAVVICFSDHGEEVYDYRRFESRSSFYTDDLASWMHCQLDIPFFIFVTESYKNRHPDLTNKITKAVHRPFMIDDLPHLLFDLAGIRTKGYDSCRSVINDSYNDKRERMVTDWNETKIVNYDSVCPLDQMWKIGWSK